MFSTVNIIGYKLFQAFAGLAVCIVASVAAYFAVVVRSKIFLVYPEFFKTHVCGALGIFNPLFDFVLRTVAATLGKGKLNIQRIYLFYNGQQCYECPQAIELAEEVYNDEFAGLYSLFVIDYTDEDGFNYAEVYDLYTPLAMVLVKISNGEMLGWHKINNLQNFADDEDYFTKYLSGQINDFLAHDDF